jgi:AraC-like DNA-binding protein
MESKGILNPAAADTKFQLSRHVPAPDICYFVEFYWIVSWDLCGQEPYVQETLPYPCIHLVFEKGKTRIFGVITGKFSRLLKDQGRAFGVKFRPGAFYPFLKSPVSGFTNDTLSLEDVFDIDSTALEQAILSQADEAAMIEIVEHFLRPRLPHHDQQIELINQIVERIIANRAIIKVDDLVSRFNFSKRTLQRIFSQYVGVGPKWVIKRYRLHEAAEQLAAGEVVDWPRLALDLGYFDQAHFIKDFKTIVGRTPAEYAKHLGSGA